MIRKKFAEWILEKAKRQLISELKTEVRTYVQMELFGGNCTRCNPRINCDPTRINCSVINLFTNQIYERAKNDSLIKLAYRTKELEDRLSI